MEESLGGVSRKRRPPSEIASAFEADRARVRSCAAIVKETIRRHYQTDVDVAALPVQNALIVDVPDDARVAEIQEGLPGRCEAVESVSDDWAGISAIMDSCQVDGVP
jgi:hypothetical protein